MKEVRQSILVNICKDLNVMEARPPSQIVKIEGSATSGSLTVTSVPSPIDNPLVMGPHYEPDDIKFAWVTQLGKLTSGVCVVGINKGCSTAKKLHDNMYLRRFELHGRFGCATDTYHEEGKLIEKTTYAHVTRAHIDRILATWQAAHQKQMFISAGVDPQSQEAFELAVKGPIRPAGKSVPIIYSLKCVNFVAPDFVLEIECINEEELYLLKLVHELGLDLKSTAMCTRIRQVRFGHFTLDMALLRKHWTLEHILNGINHCKPLTEYQYIQSMSPHLQEANTGSRRPQTKI